VAWQLTSALQVRQIGAGQDALTVLSIQVSQSAARFGVWGAAVGAGVAVLGPLASSLFTAKEASAAADEAAKRYAATQEKLKALIDNSTTAIHDQAAAISGKKGPAASRWYGSRGGPQLDGEVNHAG
jgi:hypothetical protein